MRVFMILMFLGALVLAAWTNNTTDAVADKISTASTVSNNLMMPPAGRGTQLNFEY